MKVGNFIIGKTPEELKRDQRIRDERGFDGISRFAFVPVRVSLGAEKGSWIWMRSYWEYLVAVPSGGRLVPYFKNGKRVTVVSLSFVDRQIYGRDYSGSVDAQS